MRTPVSDLGPVVLVDDDAALRAAVTFSLEAAGLVVLAFPDAEAVLAATLPPGACLVLDQRLPGLSGLDVYERLRDRGEDWPTIFITSNPKPDLKLKAAIAGVPIIEKPLLQDTLIEAIHTLHDQRRYH